MIDKNNKELSIRRQSQLLSLNRSSLYLQHKSKESDLGSVNKVIAI